MALKDWKEEKAEIDVRGIFRTWHNKKNNDDISIFHSPFTGWTVGFESEKEYDFSKVFNNSSEALKFAKSYMRTH